MRRRSGERENMYHYEHSNPALTDPQRSSVFNTTNEILQSVKQDLIVWIIGHVSWSGKRGPEVPGSTLNKCHSCVLHNINSFIHHAIYLIVLEERSISFLLFVQRDEDVETGSLQVYRRGCAFDRVEKRQNFSAADESRTSGRERKWCQFETSGVGCGKSRVRSRQPVPTIINFGIL